jgi:dipeptidyl aminopeptidase/acylaminoacyl peptidase
LSYLELRSSKVSYLTTNIKWDVDEFELSPDGNTIAFVTNEDGISRLYILDTGTGKQKAISSLPVGIASSTKWHNNSKLLAFNFKSPSSPNDIYVLNIETGQIEVWAKSISSSTNLGKISTPELFNWKSFDGRTLSGFIYFPLYTGTGKRPVIIDIHGGPEDQHRPGYSYDDNFIINELGVVKIYPNVRGSTGYGKTFLNLDNGLRREDAVKDVGYLLNWIKTQPRLDASRVLIQGESYGGYLALSVATKYSNQIKGVISDSGFSNLATMVEGTTEWRRSIQRAEFGDERDPEIKTLWKELPLLTMLKILRFHYLLYKVGMTLACQLKSPNR